MAVINGDGELQEGRQFLIAGIGEECCPVVQILIMFWMGEAVDEDGQKIEVVLAIGLPLVVEGVDDAGLALLVLFILDVGVNHELADAAEQLSVDHELFEVALDTKLVKVRVFVVGLGKYLFLSKVCPDAPP